jgi:hypothetical protein
MNVCTYVCGYKVLMYVLLVRMYICMFIHYVCLYVCTCVRMWVHVSVCTYVVRMYVCRFIYTYAIMFVRIMSGIAYPFERI